MIKIHQQIKEQCTVQVTGRLDSPCIIKMRDDTEINFACNTYARHWQVPCICLALMPEIGPSGMRQ